MFVQSNKLSDLKIYFNNKLKHQFSLNEIKLMFEFCVLKRLGSSRTELIFGGEKLLSESDLLFFKDIIDRLLLNEPFQYIIGETLFCDLDILCDKRALIPRPETEELVYWILESFPSKNEKLRLVDFCTGSGCIALSLKHQLKESNLTATDFSENALDLAKKNAQFNKLDVLFYEHNLLLDNVDFIENHSLDCIVSNPPYIPEKDKLLMHENVLEFEPHLALFVSNDNPLVFYQRIAEIAKDKLKKNALLFFEIHENLSEEVKTILLNLEFTSIEVKKDLQGKNRMIKAIL